MLWSMHPFQTVTAFFCILAGYILVGFTNDQVDILLAYKVDVGFYGMLHVSFTFFTFTYVLIMICFYRVVRGKSVTDVTNEDAYELHESVEFEVYHQRPAYQPVNQHGDNSRIRNVNSPSFEDIGEEKDTFNRL
ncbi:hypothetical protein IWQ61_001759 [Dispira simplex]|nr:hypothetical protein IWQ61_001759 [Dispira simplex]